MAWRPGKQGACHLLSLIRPHRAAVRGVSFVSGRRAGNASGTKSYAGLGTDPRPCLGSESEASVWRSVDRANAVPRPSPPGGTLAVRPGRAPTSRVGLV